MTGRPVPIHERIACWQTAYSAVLEEILVPHRALALRGDTSPRSNLTESQYLQAQDVAARVAATLAIGATTTPARSPHEGLSFGDIHTEEP